MKKIILFSLALTLNVNLLKAQVIDAAGGGGAYSIANYPGNFTGYYNGFSIVFRSNHNTPGASTMKVGASAVTPIVNTAATALASGDIKTNQVVTIVYDVPGGNVFQMVTTSGNVGAGAGISGGGTAGTIPKFTGANTLGNSMILDDGTNVGVGAAPAGSYKLEVNGLVGSLGINETSDQRYKKNIFTIENALQKVVSLRGVNYDWRKDEFKEKNFVATSQIGLVAQEVEKIIPQVVTTDVNGYKSLEYSKLVALLIEAVKEQQEKILSLEETVGHLKNENQSLRAKEEKEMQTLKADVKTLHDAVDILLKEAVSLQAGEK